METNEDVFDGSRVREEENRKDDANLNDERAATEAEATRRVAVEAEGRRLRAQLAKKKAPKQRKQRMYVCWMTVWGASSWVGNKSCILLLRFFWPSGAP